MLVAISLVLTALACLMGDEQVKAMQLKLNAKTNKMIQTAQGHLGPSFSPFIRRRRDSAGVNVPPNQYHDYDQLVSELRRLNQVYPSLTELYTLSEKTVGGRDILAMRISTEPNRRKLKPMFKYVGNMHGNEVTGREVLLSFIEYVLQTYTSNPKHPEVGKLVRESDLHIIPTMNPDGFEKASQGECEGSNNQSGRNNNNGVDLNRDFPTWDDLKKTRSQLLSPAQPETRALIRWILDNPFVLSANLHDGSVVVNYPYDDNNGTIPSLSPDNDVFKDLALTYARNHGNMHQGVGLCGRDNFPQGITNGAAWYSIPGGMQDFNYLFSNSFEVTIEMSCCKYPPVSQLKEQWHLNKYSLVRYLLKGHTGIKGIVLRQGSRPVQNAKVEIIGIAKDVFTTDRGEYWRILVPGIYRVRAVAPNGEYSRTYRVRVGETGKSQRLDLTLTRHRPSLAFQLPPYFSKSKAGMTSAPSGPSTRKLKGPKIPYIPYIPYIP